MKVIIAGDREVKDATIVERAVKKSGFKVTKVLCGDARGSDKLGEDWAKKNKIPVEHFPAKWDDIEAEGAVVKSRVNPWTKKQEKYNANAGFQRNQQMVDNAEALIALQPNGPTSGTQDTIKLAKKKGIPIYIYEKEDSEYEYHF